ncbi:trypsin-like serine protease [Vibrio sp. SM6]|uniref:Trypsin-like serine protease n=1 Tax=Vibrio agarilyticus TaxID=2726741 RepID=A0A7X8TR95_9VIBR|nr:trypsin-like serine protease [Vibrio agarilyticus]NLS13294.1 trypsin-like serine protease [Vibrio agarilyticus]
MTLFPLSRVHVSRFSILGTTLASLFLAQPAMAALSVATADSNDETQEIAAVSPRIVNGNVVSAQAYPSFASLFYDTLEYTGAFTQTPFCGAAILDPSHVVTAAHCIEGDISVQMYVTVVPQLENERDYPFGNVQRHRVSAIYYPDTFINSGTFLFPDDIAILKLDTPMNIDAVNDVAMLSSDESYRRTNAVFNALGHGNTRSGSDTSSRLLATSLSYATNSVCANVFLNGFRLTGKQICFDGDFSSFTQLKNSTCQGDSGGPVYWQTEFGQQILVGLTSFGPNQCGDPDLPITSVFTELQDYRSWIANVLAGSEAAKVTITNAQRDEFYASGGTSVSNGDNSASIPTASGGSSGGGIGLGSAVLAALLFWRRRAAR